MMKRLMKLLQPKSIRRLEQMQEYILIHKGIYVSKEEIADRCVEVCHKKIIEEGKF